MKLADFAVPYAVTAGRAHDEKDDVTRTPFQRDRDRIIHAKAFRRLSGKTQVFRAKHTDHIRDRLTHSLEVAQVARDIARMLRVNEDVCEAVALAHDLGHTPFGHAGEEALDEMMQKHGSHFEHNEQSKRIVEVLEHPFPHFVGLNLTFEVLDGLAKHQTLYDQKTKKMRGKTLEAQIVDKADEIAYHTHDLDDGLRLKLFSIEEASQLAIVKRAVAGVESEYHVTADNAPARVVAACMSQLITDLTAHTIAELARRDITTMAQVVAQKDDRVSFSPRFAKEVVALRAFLWERMYQAKEVVNMSRHGQVIVKKLFRHYYKHPELLPEKHRAKIDVTDSREVVVKDYIAGMTDWFAVKQVASL